MRRLISLALLLTLLTLPALSIGTTPARAAIQDWAISDGWFYTQTAVDGSGFAVRDSGGVPFWTAMQRAGGVAGTGYPVSERFVWQGFTMQAFQKVVFQWQPETGQVAFLNVFDILHEQGYDPWLFQVRAVPDHARINEAGLTWQQIVSNRQALLDANPAIRAQYYSVPNPIAQYGLPTSEDIDFGNVEVVRLQRAVIQQWKVPTPWAHAGQVTVANGGDVLKESGLLPAEALRPTAAPAPVGPSPARLSVRNDPALDPALDVLDRTRLGRDLVVVLAETQSPVSIGRLPENVRGAYLPFLGAILVNPIELETGTPETVAAIIAHEAVHLRDDVNGVFDGSPWQCYQSELRAFTLTAEVWRELYPGGKPNPTRAIENELNGLITWVDSGTDLDRLNSLAERYQDQCS